MFQRSVQGVIFIGSVGAGRIIAAEAARNLKKSVLELGGNDPFVVLESADLDKAIDAAFNNRLTCAG